MPVLAPNDDPFSVEQVVAVFVTLSHEFLGPGAIGVGAHRKGQIELVSPIGRIVGARQLARCVFFNEANGGETSGFVLFVELLPTLNQGLTEVSPHGPAANEHHIAIVGAQRHVLAGGTKHGEVR